VSGLDVSKKMKIYAIAALGLLSLANESLCQAFAGALPSDFGPTAVSDPGGPYEIKVNENIELSASITNPFNETIETYIWSFEQNATIAQIIDNDSILDLDWSFLHDNFDTSLGADIALFLDWVDVAGNSSEDTSNLQPISVITVVPEPASFSLIFALTAGVYCVWKKRKFNANKSE